MHSKRHWIFAAGACSCALALPACNPTDEGGADSSTSRDSSSATDGRTFVRVTLSGGIS